MTFLKLFVCLITFGGLGWLGRKWFSSSDEIKIEDSFLDLLTGMAMLSLLYLGLATGGWFRGRYLVGTFGLLAGALWFFSGRKLPGQQDLRLLLLTSFFCSLLAFSLFRLTPPYEAIVLGDDASVYSAAGAQLAHSGKLSYSDALVQEMNSVQREAFFRNRYREDWTGPFARFSGGVRLLDPENGTVHFAFYHMTPVWLAFFIKTFGFVDYEICLSMVSALTLLSLFFLGKRTGGTMAGLALPAVLFVFYPQQYFSRFPLSEPFAQLFFLAGLLSMVQSLASGTHPAELRRTGILWGVSFLCRVDSIYMIALFLVVCLPSFPLFARDRRRWLPLLRILCVCALAALYNQVRAGEYISLFENSQNLRISALTDLGLDLITLACRFVNSYPALSNLLLLGLIAAVLGIKMPQRHGERAKHPYVAVLFTLVAAGAMLLPITGMPPSLSTMFNHVRWVFPYAPPALLCFIAAGVLYLAVRERFNPSVQVCLILFALACAMYLFRPLIFPAQPWATRRFVPILLPLFFLLGLSGWNRATGVLRAAKPWARTLLFCLATGVCCLLLYSKSRYLFDEPLYNGVFSQSDTLASQIPGDALVLIPGAIAGMHLELPLQYRNGLETLTLPLDYKTGRRLSNVVRDYLDAKIEKGPVVLLSLNGTDLIYPMWKYYQPRQLGRVPFSVLLVPRFDRYQYPEKTQRMNFDATFYLLSPFGSSRLHRNVLSYDDPAITFLHFHEKEGGFRWTRDNSIVTDFSFRSNGKPVDLLLEVGPLPPGFQPDDPGVNVTVNYKIPAGFIATEGKTLRYRLKPGAVEEIHSVSIQTGTFREQTGSLARELGISFVKLSLLAN